MRTGELHCLRDGLWAHHGHRTLWWDSIRGTVLHTEPELELEDEGLAYLGTVLRPSIEELAEAVGRVTCVVPETTVPGTAGLAAPVGAALFAS